MASVGAPRCSSINGLLKGSLSITIDGVDVQDNLLRSSDGYFTYVRPRVDAIEDYRSASLYAVLVGRVITYTWTAYLTSSGTYEISGLHDRLAKQNTCGLFVRDN